MDGRRGVGVIPVMYPPLSLSSTLANTLQLFSLRQRTASAGDPRARSSPRASWFSFSPSQFDSEPDDDGDDHEATTDRADTVTDTDTDTDTDRDTVTNTVSPSHALDPPLSPSAKEIARLRAELKLTRDKQHALQTALREAHTQVRTKDILLDQIRARARALESDALDARRAADERRQEVKSMERFLTKTDRWAGSDLVQTVKDINSEILQFAAAASEGFPAPSQSQSQASASTPASGSTVRSGRPGPSNGAQNGPTPGRRKALERVAARFGTKMRQCLEKRDHAQDPTLLQYALQACVCQCISHAMASFCFGSTGKLESHLSKIYQHMHSSEPQPTSSRWRALTHQHIRALSPNIDTLAVSEVTDTCLRGVANVLSAGGFGEVDDLLGRAATKYTTQLRRVAELANRFALVIREGTMSTDFQALFVESVREFSPATMENVYDGYGPSKGRVLCTTEIGLQCLTNRGRDGKDFSAQTIERRVVLKPRVVLENIVQVMDR
ncbi:hypothetical protein DFH11DRAFT_871185 [Phellopilus nigrolimitatus]|nr:hypothetical protein DFH11DRAFT_871185 [Phellopilus nigrolimitatus]